MSDHTALDVAIAMLGLEYKAEFVPQRLSRNSGDKQPSLNWRVTISKDSKPLTTDYMQGIGHLPKPNMARARDGGPWTVGMLARRGADAAQRGEYDTGSGFCFKKVPAPLLRDVLYSLVRDADVLGADGFEDWASDYGYDVDSREAEATYNECVKSARALQRVLGRQAIEQLRELFQDY